MKRFAIMIALVALAASSFAQERQPRGKAETTINGKSVTIDYGRPALKGRTIDELMNDLPEDRVWRAGENQVTILDTKTPLKIGGTNIPAGKYSLYVYAPTEGDWSLCVNKHLGVPLKEIFAQAPPELANEPWPMLMGYDKNIKDSEVARIKMKKMNAESSDVFTIDLTNDMLTMSWGGVSYGTSIEAGM
jgi:hypothetical protein